jgi:hypothetical protein
METLFDGKIEYDSDSELKLYMANLDLTSAVKVLEVALEYALSQGTFSLKEAAVLAASLMEVKNAPKQDSNPL